MFISRWPARYASVHGSMCGAQRVRQVCRRVYSSKPSNLAAFCLVCLRRVVVASLIAFACCFLRLEGSTCPLLVRAGKIHCPPADLENLISRIAFTRGVIGIRRRALSVLPY